MARGAGHGARSCTLHGSLCSSTLWFSWRFYVGAGQHQIERIVEFVGEHQLAAGQGPKGLFSIAGAAIRQQRPAKQKPHVKKVGLKTSGNPSVILACSDFGLVRGGTVK